MVTAMPLPFEPPALTNDPAQIRRLLGLPPGGPLPDDVIEQMEWSAKNRDNPNPVLRAFARAPLVEEPLPAEIRAELDERMEQIRAGMERAPSRRDRPARCASVCDGGERGGAA
jgi:hypothetical protein